MQSDIIGLIYDAAVDSEKWHLVLDSLLLATNSRSGLLYEFNRRTGSRKILTANNLKAESMEAYFPYYASIDLWHDYVSSRSNGEVFQSRQACSDSDFEKTEFYLDFLQPQDIFYAMGGLVSVIGDRIYILGLHRSRKMGSYKNDAHLLTPFFQHFDRALHIAAKLEGLHADKICGHEALDQLAVGIMLLNDSLQIQHMNDYMKKIISNGEVLAVSSEGVQAVDQRENQQLRTALTSLIQSDRKEQVRSTIIMKLGEFIHDRPPILFARPIKRHEGFLQGQKIERE